MKQFNIGSRKYRNSDQQANFHSDRITSPVLRKLPTYQSQCENPLVSNSSEIALSKVQFKQKLDSIKSLPNFEYKSHLQSLLTMMSSPASGASLSLSPKSGDSNSQYTEKDLSHLSTRNLQLKPLFSLPNLIARAGYKIHAGKGQIIKNHEVGVIIKPNFRNTKGEYLFAVCEGHGPEGHNLVKFFKSHLLSILELHLHIDLDALPTSFSKLGEFLYDSFQESDSNLNFSGCSMVNVLVHGDMCFVANIGNCRAVLGKLTDEWQCVELNQPHDLSNPQEKKRILDFGGKIQRFEDTYTGEIVERFELGGGIKSVRFECTRGIGLTAGKTIGICSVPDVFKFQIRHEDKFVIVASSAVWKVITPREALEIAIDGWVNKKTDLSCDALMKEADMRLQNTFCEKFDIAVVLFFINSG